MPARKKSAKSTSSKKSSAKKNSAKKISANKSSAKKSSAKRSGARKYSPATSEVVREEMAEFKEGKLRSGRSGKKVTDRKQAVAIALSEARREGKKVPRNRNRAVSKKKS